MSTAKRCRHTTGSGATGGIVEIAQTTNKTHHEPVNWTPETTINNTSEVGRRADTLVSQIAQECTIDPCCGRVCGRGGW